MIESVGWKDSCVPVCTKARSFSRTVYVSGANFIFIFAINESFRFTSCYHRDTAEKND